MGDRGNIVCRFRKGDPTSDVYFYTHWSGTEIGQTTQKALASGKDRWDDPAYLARIIFQTLLGGDVGNTGFGISLSLCDNEHDLIVVDMDDSRVYKIDRAEANNIPAILQGGWSFDEFVALDPSVVEV